MIVGIMKFILLELQKESNSTILKLLYLFIYKLILAISWDPKLMATWVW